MDLLQTIVAIFTPVGIIAAIILGINQNRASSKTILAQSFLTLHSLDFQSRGPNGEDGIAAIHALPRYTTYQEFIAKESAATVQAIYNAVAFLNFIAILSEEGYMNVQDAWDIYFWAYRKSYEKLYPWWIDSQREANQHLFPGFERACLTIGLIPADAINVFDKRALSGFVKTYHEVSRVPSGKLAAAFQSMFERNRV
jgi:hypothetical protein